MGTFGHLDEIEKQRLGVEDPVCLIHASRAGTTCAAPGGACKNKATERRGSMLMSFELFRDVLDDPRLFIELLKEIEVRGMEYVRAAFAGGEEIDCVLLKAVSPRFEPSDTYDPTYEAHVEKGVLSNGELDGTVHWKRWKKR